MGTLIRQEGDDVLIAVKAVPGAAQDEIAGVLGERLKVRISAPAEGGRANEAVRRVIAGALGVRVRRVTIESGRAGPEKVVRVVGVRREEVGGRLW